MHGGIKEPLDTLMVGKVDGEKIYRLQHAHYGKPAGTLFIMKEKSFGVHGRHFKPVYKTKWPQSLKDAVHARGIHGGAKGCSYGGGRSRQRRSC